MGWFRNFLYLLCGKKIKVQKPREWDEKQLVDPEQFYTGRVYVVGDSHAWIPFIKSNYFEKLSVGPRTAHKLDSREREIVNKINYMIDSKIIFVFGEIDCRVHLFKEHHKQQRPIEHLILDTAERYVMLVKRLRRRGYDIAILNVVPTGDAGNAGYKFYGSPAQRRDITTRFNAAVKELCIEHRIPFIDIYSELVDHKGWRKKHLIKDDVHLNSNMAGILEEHLKYHWWMYE